MRKNPSQPTPPHKTQPPPASPELTEAEWEIIKVIWESQPCTAGTVQEALQQDKGWAYSTVKTTMDRMVKKGLLEIRKIRNLQLFSATINPTEARRGELFKTLRRAFDGAIAPLMQLLIEDEKLSQKDLDALRDLVNRSEEK